MPFREALVLPPNPTVRIFLQGQLLLEPNASGSRCDLGVNRCAPDHRFSMEVRQKMTDPDSPDIILMRHVGPLMHGGFEMEADPPGIDGVQKFVPADVFLRVANQGHPRDFRWIVDLANTEFHNGRLTVNGTATEPNIRIRDGIFYTALRSDPTRVRVTRKGGNLPDLQNFRIASMIGVNIYLRPGKAFKLSCRQNGVEQILRLEKPENGSEIKSYEIWINNDPLYVDPNSSPVHSELAQYYRVIDSVEVAGVAAADFKRFDLEFDRVAGSPLGTPTIPCMPAGIEG
jgi:hypothetical protein